MKNKLSIAMYGHKRIPSREGGIEVVVEKLATEMVKRGNRVTVFNRGGKYVHGNKVLKINQYKGVIIKTIPTIDKKGLAAFTSSVFGALKASLGKYDIVHIHAEGPAAMCLLPHLFQKRTIVTIHGLDWARSKWSGFASRYIKFGERQAAKWADEIIVLSRHVQEYFKKKYNRITIYIPNGVDKPEIKEAKEIKRKWDLEKDSYVLFLGRIVPEKGLQYLLNVWKDIVTDKKLVIVGSDSDTQDFLIKLKAIATEHVIFTGFQEGLILEEFYSNAYLYILPSDLEGMPLSLLEAMSYGNCCLVSDIDECKEVVEDKAILFEHGNEDDLKKKLQMLLDKPNEVEKYKKTAADFITSKYNWKNVVDNTLQLYISKSNEL